MIDIAMVPTTHNTCKPKNIHTQVYFPILAKPALRKKLLLCTTCVSSLALTAFYLYQHFEAHEKAQKHFSKNKIPSNKLDTKFQSTLFPSTTQALSPELDQAQKWLNEIEKNPYFDYTKLGTPYLLDETDFILFTKESPQQIRWDRWSDICYTLFYKGRRVPSPSSPIENSKNVAVKFTNLETKKCFSRQLVLSEKDLKKELSFLPCYSILEVHSPKQIAYDDETDTMQALFADDKFLVQQTTRNTSAFACATMLIWDAGKDVPLDDILSDTAGNIETIVAYLEDQMLRVKSGHIEIGPCFIDRVANLLKDAPMMVFLPQYQELEHWFILDDLSEQGAIIRDPLHGWRVKVSIPGLFHMSIEDLNNGAELTYIQLLK